MNSILNAADFANSSSSHDKQRSYVEMGIEAGAKAMLDAQIKYDDVQLGVGCFCYVSLDLEADVDIKHARMLTFL